MNHRIAHIIGMLLMLLPCQAWADTYCPKVGEEFIFYPVTKVYKQILHGYDCFYNPSLAYKNGQTKATAANRFKPNAHGLTPYSEIEGHTFVVVSVMKENADQSVDKQNFLCFLRRDDGAELLLRIPFVRKSIDNTLTRGMAQVLTEKNSFRKGPAVCIINIPACPVDQLQTLSTQMKGKKLERNKGRELDMTVNTLTQYLNGADITETLFKSDDVYCENVAFTDVKGYLYQQPIAFANLRGRKIKLPVFDFRGDGESVYGSYFSINTVFRAPSEFTSSRISSVLADLDDEPEVEEKEPEPVKVEGPAKIVEPVKTEEPAKIVEPVKVEEKVVEKEPEPVREPIKVDAPTKIKAEPAQIAGATIHPDVPANVVANVKVAAPTKVAAEPAQIAGVTIHPDVPTNVVANVKMSKPTKVASDQMTVTADVIKPSVPEKIVADIVMPEPIKKPAEPELVLAEAKPTEMANPIEAVKPAEPITAAAPAKEEVAEVAPAAPTEEQLAKQRMADLTKRFGAKNAKLIANGKVSKGFTRDMCKEALGEPDYINTTQNMFTTLEQWVYGVNLYLYFQKDKLQYIDEF